MKTRCKKCKGLGKVNAVVHSTLFTKPCTYIADRKCQTCHGTGKVGPVAKPTGRRYASVAAMMRGEKFPKRIQEAVNGSKVKGKKK